MIVNEWNEENTDIKEKYERIMFVAHYIKKMIDNKSDSYSDDKVREFASIPGFILSLTVDDIEKMYHDLLILGTTDPMVVAEYSKIKYQYEKKINRENVDLDILTSYQDYLKSDINKFLKDVSQVGIIYFIAFKSNRKLLDLDDSLLYYSMNAMRCTPIEKYKETLEKINYPALVQILTNDNIKYNIGTDKDEIRLILNKLVDNIEISKETYEKSKIEVEMNEFIDGYVSNKIKKLINETEIDNSINHKTK